MEAAVLGGSVLPGAIALLLILLLLLLVAALRRAPPRGPTVAPPDGEYRGYGAGGPRLAGPGGADPTRADPPLPAGPKANGSARPEGRKKAKPPARARRDKPQQHSFSHRLLVAALKVPRVPRCPAGPGAPSPAGAPRFSSPL